MSLTREDHARLAARYSSWLADNIVESFDVEISVETANATIRCLAGVVFHTYEAADHGTNNFAEPHNELETLGAIEAGLVLLLAPLFEPTEEPHIAIEVPTESSISPQTGRR